VTGPGATAYRAVRSDDAELAARVRQAVAPRATPPPPIPIAVVGAGWIGGLQLDAYRAAGFEVVAIADRHPERAVAHRDRFFPGAEVFAGIDDLLRGSDAAVIDIATHVDGRPDAVEAAFGAGRHVLSQKPFVEDLRIGARLEAQARQAGVVLAVNQNGRWAPHFGAMLRVVAAGLIGEVVSADFSVAWPHEEVVRDRPAFADMHDLVLFDFGAHWFDLVGALAPEGGLSVRADVAPRPGQDIAAPVQADVLIDGPRFRSAMTFRAGERFDEIGAYRVSGTAGVVSHRGGALGGDLVEITTAAGTATIAIADDWFRWGLAGAMEELLRALADGRRPSNDAASAMRGLGIAFAALEAARTGARVEVGTRLTR